MTPSWSSALVGLIFLTNATIVPAADTTSLSAELTELEQLSRSLSIRYATSAGNPQQYAEHRLVDAQVLFNLKDYTRAAILLLDYVNNYKRSPGYPEALFYLAESLYLKGDYLGARRYFHELATTNKGGPHYQDALQRLIEIEMAGSYDSSNIEAYLGALQQIPAHELKPTVPYVRGKYFYFKGDIARAISAFAKIQPSHEYYQHAQYFTGAALVKKGDYGAAIGTFQELRKLPPGTSAEKHIRELTHLALGRLFYQDAKITEAIDQYQRVSRHSDLFDTALYEIAWTYVKAAQYQRALRALDLLVLAQPESSLLPDVRVLQANLLIRLKNWGRANDLFTNTRAKFEPAQRKMARVLAEHRDPNHFFDVLIDESQGALAVNVGLPKLAVHWVKDKPQVKRAMGLVKNVRALEASLNDTQKLIDRLENAVNSPAKIKVFPNFAAAKASSLQLENRLANVASAVVASERNVLDATATAEERAQLAQLERQRLELAATISTLPTTSESYQNREERQRHQLRRLSAQLAELNVLIDSLRAQLVASEKYFADTEGADEEASKKAFGAQASDIEAIIAGLQAESDQLKESLAKAQDGAGFGGPMELAERDAKADHRQLLNREHTILQTIGPRAPAEMARVFEDLAKLFQRTEMVYATIGSFNETLDRGIDEKLTSVRTLIAQQKQLIDNYATDAGQYRTETDTIAGDITYAGFRDVAQRFYEIVVRSDVGILDVAWALKDSKSKEVSGLVRQRKMDVKLLDDEFKTVLNRK